MCQGSFAPQTGTSADPGDVSETSGFGVYAVLDASVDFALSGVSGQAFRPSLVLSRVPGRALGPSLTLSGVSAKAFEAIPDTVRSIRQADLTIPDTVGSVRQGVWAIPSTVGSVQEGDWAIPGTVRSARKDRRGSDRQRNNQTKTRINAGDRNQAHTETRGTGTGSRVRACPGSRSADPWARCRTNRRAKHARLPSECP